MAAGIADGKEALLALLGAGAVEPFPPSADVGSPLGLRFVLFLKTRLVFGLLMRDPAHQAGPRIGTLHKSPVGHFLFQRHPLVFDLAVAEQPPGVGLIGVEFQDVFEDRFPLRGEALLAAPIGQHRLAQHRIGRLPPHLLILGQLRLDDLHLIHDGGFEGDLSAARHGNHVRCPRVLIGVHQIAFDVPAAAEREVVRPRRLQKSRKPDCRQQAVSTHERCLQVGPACRAGLFRSPWKKT